MTADRIQHKIQAPPIPVPVLHRETIGHLLADAMGSSQTNQIAPHRLILLCAPAGYGKTTLLADTVQQYALSCCWYTFEDTDTPILFFKALLGSIRSHFPLFGSRLDTLIWETNTTRENWDVWLEAFIEALQNEIPQSFVLALCNYHKVQQNRVINQLINRLLAGFPQQGALVVESRSLPDLELAPLIANRQVFGLGSTGLCFDARELYELAQIQGLKSLSLQEAERLIQSSEGWIAGILLSSGYTRLHPSTQSHQETWNTPDPLEDQRSLAHYIENEIFGQERATYEFLEATSVLKQLTSRHCNELLGIDNAAQQLIYAEQQGLFVVRTRESLARFIPGVYKCHPILREFFREQLRSHSFERYLRLQQRAAQILQQDQAYHNL